MGTLYEEFWLSEGAGATRTERKSGAYKYYLPTPLDKLMVYLESDTVGDVGRAEQAIAKLNNEASALQSSEGIARLLLRAEAVSSSYIEGLSIGTRRLLKAEMKASGEFPFKHDEGAVEIIGNIHAMQQAVEIAQGQKRITTSTIKGIHKILCSGTSIEKYGGEVRTKQNWVGGNVYNPLNADYIPPSPQHVLGLLDDLATFCNDTIVSPIVQAALAHAQFESIHPFIDGNGRTGRALIHLILRRRGLAPNLVPPISLVMATHSKSYILGLADYRFLDSNTDEVIQAGLNDWISFFAGACLRACAEASSFENSASELKNLWRKKLGMVRKNSALDLILDELVGMPMFTIASASAATGRAISAVTNAVDRCIDAGIIKPMSSQKRNRTFEVPEVISQFNIFEKRLASPAGNTK